jgi:hypothetical protein
MQVKVSSEFYEIDTLFCDLPLWAGFYKALLALWYSSPNSQAEILQSCSKLILKLDALLAGLMEMVRSSLYTMRVDLTVPCTQPERWSQTQATWITVLLTWFFNSHMPLSSLHLTDLSRCGRLTAPLLPESRTCPHTVPFASLSGLGASQLLGLCLSHWQHWFQNRGFWKTEKTQVTNADGKDSNLCP